jgi:hypothetical protein
MLGFKNFESAAITIAGPFWLYAPRSSISSRKSSRRLIVIHLADVSFSKHTAITERVQRRPRPQNAGPSRGPSYLIGRPVPIHAL